MAGEDGQKLIDFAFAILQADIEKLKPTLPAEFQAMLEGADALLVVKLCMPEIRDRLAALTYITEHGFGKAAQPVEEGEPITGSDEDLLFQVLDAMPADTVRRVLEKKRLALEGAH